VLFETALAIIKFMFARLTNGTHQLLKHGLKESFMGIFFFGMILGLVGIGPVISLGADAPGTTNILLFSDLHLDTNAPAGRYLTDADASLIGVAMESARSNCPCPAGILITGDFFRHPVDANRDNDTNRFEEIEESMTQIVRLLRNTFPDTPVLPALGNNDSDKGDYLLPSSTFLQDFATLWVKLVEKPGHVSNSDDFANHFAKDGCYVAELPGISNLKFIVFNSTAVSARNSESKGDDSIRWVSNCLHVVSRTNKAWILCHIPVGKELRTDNSFWRSNFEKSFLRLVASENSPVTAMFCAHTHMDEFRVICNADSKPVLFEHFVPSVSTRKGNNPSYQKLTVDIKSGEITDYTTYYLQDLQKPKAWTKEYEFSEKFGRGNKNYDATTLFKLASDLQPDRGVESGILRSNFSRFYDASRGSPPSFKFDNLKLIAP
jgi:hypothetical protein